MTVVTGDQVPAVDDLLAGLVFSVFFSVVFCPFVAAVFALVDVLEFFNV